MDADKDGLAKVFLDYVPPLIQLVLHGKSLQHKFFFTSLNHFQPIL